MDGKKIISPFPFFKGIFFGGKRHRLLQKERERERKGRLQKMSVHDLNSNNSLHKYGLSSTILLSYYTISLFYSKLSGLFPQKKLQAVVVYFLMYIFVIRKELCGLRRFCTKKGEKVMLFYAIIISHIFIFTASVLSSFFWGKERHNHVFNATFFPSLSSLAPQTTWQTLCVCHHGGLSHQKLKSRFNFLKN